MEPSIFKKFIISFVLKQGDVFTWRCLYLKIDIDIDLFPLSLDGRGLG